MELRLSETARLVLAARYLARDSSGEVAETPEEMFRRVARAVAQAEQNHGSKKKADEWTERFFLLMAGLEFLPNSPTLMNAGRRLGQLAACFVLPIEDSIRSIFETLKQSARIHQSGGGTGFNFSHIRPAGDVVRSTHGVSSGPLSFLRIFDLATETIKQGGTRRGANMGLLRVDHPDIFEFIKAKEAPGLNNFNLSVSLPDSFMAVLAAGGNLPLINPRTGRAVSERPAREIFEALVASAHQSGEPGVIFIDQINRFNPTPDLGPIEATNPCGEQPLLANEACNLGSINLAAMASGNSLDWERLERVVQEGVRFLDDVITVNRYPLPKIREMTHRNRKIGLGVMGFADLLIKLGLPYDSQEAVALANEVMVFIQQAAKEASCGLAMERGSFPGFANSPLSQEWPAMRNATVTTIAPTGSISLVAGVSSGIEPLFGLALGRRILKDQNLPELHPAFLAALEGEGRLSHVIDEVGRLGRCRGVEGVPDKIARLFPTAHEIETSWHLKIQAAFQKETDNAVSKTINLPAEAGVDQVAEAIQTAFELGLKGLTLYRNKSRPDQVLELGLTPDQCHACRFG